MKSTRTLAAAIACMAFATLPAHAATVIPLAMAVNMTYTSKGYGVENGNGVDLRFEIGYVSGSTFELHP